MLTPPMPMASHAGADSNRRLRACLSANALWLLLALAAMGLRWEGQHWGFVLGQWQRDALAAALTIHVVAGLLCAALIGSTFLGTIRSDRWARMTLALLPLMILISVDRLATIEFRAVSSSQGLLQADPVRIWSNRPGFSGQEFGVSYSINTWGLRGREIPLTKPRGRRRVLLLGDSIAFGMGIEEPDLMVTHLEHLAAQRFPDDQLEWINGSVIGYSPWQEHEWLEAVGLPLRPDLIVYTFCLNDIGQKFNLVQYGGSTRDLAPPEPSAMEWSGLVRMARDLSMQWFGPTRKELRARDALYGNDRAIDEPEAPEIQQAWSITLKSMTRIVDLARAHGLPIVIVCFPQARQVDAHPGDQSAPQEVLRRFCNEQNVPFLDLLPVYRRIARDQGMAGEDLFPDGTHPTPNANRIAAKAMFEFLLDERLLPFPLRSTP